MQDLIDGLRINLQFTEYNPDDIYLFFNRIDFKMTGHITFN